MTRAGAATPRAMASIAPRNSATTTTTAAATATRAVAPRARRASGSRGEDNHRRDAREEVER